MRSRTCTVFAVIAIVAAMVPAFCRSAAADDREACKTASGDVAIEACSRAIASGKIKGRTLSLLYTNRGVEYFIKGEFDRAIADYDQATKLNPKYAAAFYNRGIAKQKKGDMVGGDVDIVQARQLQPGLGQRQ